MDNMKRKVGCIVLIGAFLCTMQFFYFIGKNYYQENSRETFLGFSTKKETMDRKVSDTDRTLIVIDAGHGGIDPGKVGVTGTKEKEINLAVAKELKELLEQNDITVIMTREGDDGLYQESDRNKKTADMRARIQLLTETKPVLAISIHQNSFTSSSSRGAQVFYYQTSKAGKELALIIQEAMRRELADGNHRQAKGNDVYYMLKKSECPLVIVECGFLSNPQEEELLASAVYQRKLAWSIHLGIMEWLSKQEEMESVTSVDKWLNSW